MLNIDFTPYLPKLKVENDIKKIFCIIRKKWLLLTPEEWVRQLFLAFLISYCKYPKTSIAVEKKIKNNEKIKRFDILVYVDMQPWLLVECKAPDIKLTDAIIMQSAAYQHDLNVKYICITNGGENYCLDCSNNQLKSLNNLPNYPI